MNELVPGDPHLFPVTTHTHQESIHSLSFLIGCLANVVIQTSFKVLIIADVVEELFGEIADEHDVENLIDTQLNDREFVFSARHEIDNLNTKYKLNLPESESYNTLSGMIFETTESIPEKGEKVMIGDYTFVITRVSSNRLEEVKLILPEED